MGEGRRGRRPAGDVARNRYGMIMKRAEDARRSELSLVRNFAHDHFSPDIFTEGMKRTLVDRSLCRAIIGEFCSDGDEYDSMSAAAALEIGMIALSIHSMIPQDRDQPTHLSVGISVLAGDVCLMKAVSLALDAGLIMASAALAHLLTRHAEARVLETTIGSASLDQHRRYAFYLRCR